MEEVIFQKVMDSDLYTVADGNTSVWCAYLYPDIPLEPPGRLSLNDTWEIEKLMGGAYLFASSEPNSYGVFIGKVKNFLKCLGSFKNVIIWFSNPDEEFSTENVWYLKINSTKTNIFVTDNNLNIIFGKYINFSIPSGCIVKYNPEFQHFTISQGPSEAQRIAFSGTASQRDTEVLDKLSYVPFATPSRGSFRFRMLAHDSDFYDNFKVALKYFYRDCKRKKDVAVNYPIFQPTKTRDLSLKFQVALDPLSQVNEENNLRTYLAFENYSLELSSYFRTHFGRGIKLIPGSHYEDQKNYPYLIPKPCCSMFVFAPQHKKDSSEVLPLYMLPKGDFHILVPSVKVPIQILCGLSGTETISCMPRTARYVGDVLSFLPGQAAYASGFSNFLFGENGSKSLDKCDEVIENASYDNKFLDEELLSEEYLTAWVAVKRVEKLIYEPEGYNTDILYLAQGEDSSLFRKVDNYRVLDYYQPIVVNMIQNPHYIPLVPHGGTKLGSKIKYSEANFEFEIIAVSRKKKFDPSFYVHMKKDINFTESIKATTPQGLLLKINVGLRGEHWEELLLANNLLTPQDSQPISLKFEDLKPKLRNAFQTNQQFLVISKNIDKNIGTFKNEIPIAGWPFKINILDESYTSGEYKNILICKFCKGALVDRVKNPKLWTNPEYFNDVIKLQELSNFIWGHINEAIKLANKGDENYSYFARIVQDPNWNGILALKTDLNIMKFPRELTCLLGGMDTDKLYAHHIGINVNRVQASGSSRDLSMDKVSSLFGFIGYKGDDNDSGGDDVGVTASAFNVLKLEALFKNSKLTAFSSEVKLTLDRLFDSDIEGDEGKKDIIFCGSYEDHDGVPSYVFNTTGKVEAKLDNTILETIEISKANFRTVGQKVDGASKEISTRFSFWGRLNFGKVGDNEIDLFSYGKDGDPDLPRLKGEKGPGLAFSNLGIGMKFKLESGGIDFEFLPNDMTLDIGQSIKRKKSFVEGFPLQLSSFISGKDFSELETKGYLPIGNIGDGEGKKWYGFDYSLDLGSMGDLSSNNSLVSSVAICWSSESKVFFGIKIPGISQQNTMFKLQEVIDSKFEGIDLSYENGVYELTIKDVSQLFIGKNIPQIKSITLFKSQDTGASSLGWYMGSGGDYDER